MSLNEKIDKFLNPSGKRIVFIMFFARDIQHNNSGVGIQTRLFKVAGVKMPAKVVETKSVFECEIVKDNVSDEVVIQNLKKFAKSYGCTNFDVYAY